MYVFIVFFFSSRRRHTRFSRDWSSDVCSSDLSGREPVLEGLNLDEIGIEYDRNGIKVNDHFETNIEGIYAIGDVIGGIMLAHVRSEERRVGKESRSRERRDH